MFYLFCEFSNGTSRYLCIQAPSKEEAHRQAIRNHYASTVLWIIHWSDPLCEWLLARYTNMNYEFREIGVLSLNQ